MRHGFKILVILGLCALVCAALLHQKEEHLRARHILIPSSTSIAVLEGFSVTNDFTVGRASFYRAEIIFTREMSTSQLESFVLRKLRLTYKLTEDGRTIREGRIPDTTTVSRWYTKDKLSRYLTFFDGVPSKDYSLSIQMEQSFPELYSAKPILAVAMQEEGLFEIHDEAQPYVLARWSSLACGAILIFAGVIARIRSRKKGTAAPNK
jgi:hypothetical protein